MKRKPKVLLGAVVLAAALAVPGAQAAGLKHYDSSKKSFWEHPPADWFLGDETEAQKGLAPKAPPATGVPLSEIENTLKHIKLPKGFHISLWAHDVPSARQMAWGNKGTLFVGAFGVGNVYAITGPEGNKQVKVILKGMKMPTGIAFRDGALYVADIDRILKYPDAEDNLDHMPAPQVVYDDMPSYVAHGWKYLVFDKHGWLWLAFGPPFNIGLPPVSVSQIRRVNPENGLAEIRALGVRNSVGGDIDPRTGDYWFSENARDWLSDNTPSDKLNHISRMGQHFGYPYCHQGNIPDPKFAMGHKCSEFTPPVLNLGPHVAPLGMKFYTGKMFPKKYRNNIFLAEHGSWNRHVYLGARIMRIVVDPKGRHAKQYVFASGWLKGKQDFHGRPADVIVAPDGALLIADDWANAIYRISYGM